MAGAEFQRVVVGVADGGLQRIAAEVRAQRPARTVYLPTADRIIDGVLAARAAGERSRLHVAGLAQAQAERGISGIWLNENPLAMARRADITRTEDGLRSGLPLNRKHPLFGVGRAVVDVVSGNTLDRLIGAPVDIGIGVACARNSTEQTYKERAGHCSGRWPR